MFSVARILASIGSDRFEASLVMFAIPAIVPVPGPKSVVTGPMSVIACRLAWGEKQITLPRAILRKTVTRRALAVAIHAALPILEAAEKVVKPRWKWLAHARSRRALGLFVFLLALAIAYPLFGFNALHALSIFVISLGMAEQDGVAVLIGVVAGLLSLATLATSGVSGRALRAKVGKILRKVGKKLGLRALTRELERRGYSQYAQLVTQIATALNFDWSQLLLLWDPEKEALGHAAAHAPQDLTPEALPALLQELSAASLARHGDWAYRRAALMN